MQIKYYKGEAKNPYEGKDSNKAMFWLLEKDCTRLFSSNMLSEYLYIGLGDFNQYDNVPIVYKALLFNAYAKTEQSLMDASANFKSFYMKYYG